MWDSQNRWMPGAVDTRCCLCPTRGTSARLPVYGWRTPSRMAREVDRFDKMKYRNFCNLPDGDAKLDQPVTNAITWVYP